MPCNKCGSKLVYHKNALTCPSCNCLTILGKEDALKIAAKRKAYIREFWKTELKKCHRDSLVSHIVNHRDTLSWDVFQKPGITDIDGIFSDTLFIKRVFEDGNKDGRIVIDDDEKSKPIIKLFTETKKVETDYYLVESENATFIQKKDHEINSVTNEQALTDFIFVETEEYDKLIKNLEKYNIVSREKAKKLQEEHKEEFNKIAREKRTPISQTTEQFIKRNYETITSYYLVFLRNEIYSQVFDLREFKKLTSEPRKLMEFVKKFPIRNYTLNGPDYSEFIKHARKVFKKSEGAIKNILIFEDGNSGIFPLFIRVNLEDKDIVLVSQTFTAIMFILLHAVISKDVFDSVAHEYGSIFEKKVKEKFEELGFAYIPNHKDNPRNPTLEIDGIASKDDYCFVIESKNPRLPPEVESFQARKNMIDDLKGIIDGKKRTTRRGERTVEQVPSLPEKVEYVKQNLIKFNLTKINPDKIFGVVVTNNYPLLSEYRGYNFIALSDVSNEKLNAIN